MAIFLILLFPVTFIIGIFLTRWIMGWFLGPLGEAARANPKERVQYSILDIYLLIGQIAVYSIPSSLAQTPQTDRLTNMLIVAAFNMICWALSMRLLARTHIKERLPRIVLMLIYPWMAGVAMQYGFSILLFLFVGLFMPFIVVFWAIGFVIALLIFRAVSKWVLSKRERPETLMSSAQFAGGYSAPATPGNNAAPAPNTSRFTSNAGMDDDLKLQ